MLKTRENVIFQTIAHTVMILVVLIALLPFLLVFLSSITEENTLIVHGYSFFPQKFSLYAYEYIAQKGDKILRAYGITFLITIVGTLANVLMTAMLAYPLSRKDLPGRKILSFYVIFTMLFNGGLVPTYLMYANTFHIKNTIFALLIPGLLLSAMNVLLMRTYFRTSIPGPLIEAAEIDGAGQFRIFFSIIMPLGTPILVTMGLFAALGYWNDWTNGLYYLSGPKGESLYSIQNFLNKLITDIQYLANAQFSGGGAEAAKMPSVSIRMAIAFVAMIPILLIFPFLQKYFQKGITLGAVKE
ncbi:MULTISPECIES: carbohydrate ABC transporter permease [unclassified Paenibacillus]|uniref:carbohydrate ABC transporter permease n=1 Tax=unclassified Paenibacillus TaxID=185978 RepID=UPI002404CBC5|nr:MULTISPECIES: carbohydrate ABC transporter permease [unclassified Paenibacillus]MDF9843164.1 putative aldouronate transport system permease protein [Paenibacillus sp. PastF-2]MDF9849624.1 putative aldouronate transport system permease protein [Paenibacillus sp. PastM-2]MDF9856459.1 putative aldouronate transport system permease protein [Paenibacillus sp. PastF-1]MDH6481730.1 putative aldouronate transport system permease protein [Paenibacillus sp. PastH-2]MDH6509011.1 putative aldouronate t